MELKNKIDSIGDIIIKAEKYASEIISQALMEAQSIIQEALLKVEQETQRLATAKKYIEQIRKNVNDTLYKINDILDTSEKEIENHVTTIKR
ncbi:MAG: hypothetical protein GX066_02230 [Clostridiaceae bacterium]|nr:hypothetical protein [Clostridiaceae bacterium]